MNWSLSIADQIIREAERAGEFAALPGKGKPLPPDELEGVPDELRIGFKLLKNAGALPPEMQLRKEMTVLEDLLHACVNPEEQTRLRTEFSAKRLRYQLLMDERGWANMDACQPYSAQLESKLTNHDPVSTDTSTRGGS